MDSTTPISAAPPVLEPLAIRVVRPDGSSDEASRSARRAARGGRGPLSPRIQADQLETVAARQATVDEDGADGTAPRKGKAKAKGAPEGAQPIPAVPVPGRRLIIRGVRRP